MSVIVSGFDSNTLAAGDSSTALADIGFSVNVFGTTFNQLYVNTDGNVTFGSSLTSTAYPQDALSATARRILAPFYADVDTGGSVGQAITYGQGVYNGKQAFAVNWVDVAYYHGSFATSTNSFQLLIVAQGNGDFDVHYNYDAINWEAGWQNGGDTDGLGGFSARVGYYDPGTATLYEVPGSAVPGSFINGGTAPLAGAAGTGGSIQFWSRDGLMLTEEPAPPDLNSGADHRLRWVDWFGATHQLQWTEQPSTAHRLVWPIQVGSAPHRLQWSGLVSADHRGAWAIPLAPAVHRQRWDDQSFRAAQHQAQWSDAIAARATHAAVWADGPADAAFAGTQAAHQLLWADAVEAQATHGAVWSDAPAEAGFVGTQAAHHLAWRLRAEGESSHRSRWDLLARHQAGADHAQRWDMLSGINLVSVDATPQITWQGETARVESAELSADEGSPIWMAERITLSDQSIWQRIQIGDTITLAIGAETWALRVDGKGYSADHPNRQFSISAVSPLAWLGEPYAETVDAANQDQSVSAQTLITNLLAPAGAIEWQIDDWQIPRGSLALTNATPLQAARAIAEAAGAVVESAPDGTPIVRARHPVSVPDYASTEPNHRFEQSQLFGASITAAPYVGMNRVVISTEQLIGASAIDRIEYARDDDNDYSGTVRAWPMPQRDADLGHTGNPDTIIESLGHRDESIEALVEFVGGEASVQYPISAIDAIEWQHTDLGTVEPFDLSGLRSAIAGNAMAIVTYRTRSSDWRVALDQDEHVQFVLI